jgi:hypothetical protein
LTVIGSRHSGQLVKVVVTNGGTGYAAPPDVAINGVTGLAFSQMSGTAVLDVAVFNSSSGYASAPAVTFSGAGGTGAEAIAYVSAGTLRPMTFFKGRANDMYGVDGLGRGIRWDGASTAVQAIGVRKPNVPPTVSAGTGGTSGIIRSVQLVSGGAGYASAPAVSFEGGTPSRAAVGKAIISNGRVVGVTVSDPGEGYQATPTVTFTGGIGGGATFDVGVVGSVSSVAVVSSGTGYTSDPAYAPSVQFSTEQGLVQANAAAVVSGGRISRIVLLSAGTGATTTGVTATVVGGSGSSAVLEVAMRYGVNAITVGNSGTGYFTAPVITLQPSPEDRRYSSGSATAAVDAAGHVTAATVVNGGAYSLAPTAKINDTQARAQASYGSPMEGKYQCCIRYIDNTPRGRGGPRPSSISELVEVDATAGSSLLTWTFSHTGVDERVTGMELWRTTADQSVVLFRVATIDRDSPSWGGTYTEGMSDDTLKDYTRPGYGMMPVTLPSGQVNARRFEPPPSEFSVACMFQDRAWYAVDSLGLRPNVLVYSEVDEPESVPQSNELVLQENTGTPDKITALIPYASMMLIAQQAHLYKLTYVAQPVLDASMLLVAYRGILNSRCWDVMDNIVFIADGYGMYAFDGSAADSVSVPVDDYWRDGRIDFSQSEQFHVRADGASKTVRFYYCRSEDSAPVRALCYNLSSKSWWEETYPQAVTATCRVAAHGRPVNLSGLSTGAWAKPGGSEDFGDGIPYEYRSGPLSLTNERASRSVSVVYRPTATTSQLELRLHYNGSDEPRNSAITSDRGSGFVTAAGGPAAVLDMQVARSPLGGSNGTATADFSGRVDERSAGGDKHIAIALSGTQAGTNRVCLYAAKVEGAEA